MFKAKLHSFHRLCNSFLSFLLLVVVVLFGTVLEAAEVLSLPSPLTEEVPGDTFRMTSHTQQDGAKKFSLDIL